MIIHKVKELPNVLNPATLYQTSADVHIVSACGTKLLAIDNMQYPYNYDTILCTNEPKSVQPKTVYVVWKFKYITWINYGKQYVRTGAVSEISP